MKKQKQRGVNIIDAVFAMVIASMIAAAVTTSLGTWFSIRTMTASQDGANQYAQGIIAKASSVSWDKLGFLPTEGSSNLIDGTCSTAFRSSVEVGDTTLKTVTLAEGDTPATGIEQTSVAEVRGKKYCVITDITWNDGSESKPASAYGAKNISVKMSWDDRGKKRSIAVNSTRSPNIGEAIPTGISEGHDAEVSPVKSFSITKAYHDGTDAKVCYLANWNTTSDTVTAVGSTSVSLTPSSVSKTLSASDKNNEQCFKANNPSYSLYGLKVGDSAGTKFVSNANYQFPGNKLTVSGNTLSWNSYPSSGTTTYRVYRSATPEFTEASIATVTDTTYSFSAPTAPVWFMVETVNSDYSVTATSNTVTTGPPVAPATGAIAYTAPEDCFDYTDIDGPYYEYVCWARDRRLTRVAPPLYGTNDSLKRADVTAFLYREVGEPSYTPPTASSFGDVATDRMYYKEIHWFYANALANGITESNGNYSYNPGGYVTRADMAAYLYRLARPSSYNAPTTSNYSDVDSDMDYYKEMNWLKDAGVLDSSVTVFDPTKRITRGETAMWIYNWNQKFGSL
jgi:hypothetical protein